jgi:acetolactate synthase-1/2/3 large subunit
MMAGELATAKRLGNPLIFVLMSDSHLSLITIKQEKKNNPGHGTRLFGDDYRSSDHIFGVPVFPTSTTKEFRDALSEAARIDGPAVIEAFVSKSDYEEYILRGNV